jgi:hypothetical protein
VRFLVRGILLRILCSFSWSIELWIIFFVRRPQAVTAFIHTNTNVILESISSKHSISVTVAVPAPNRLFLWLSGSRLNYDSTLTNEPLIERLVAL